MHIDLGQNTSIQDSIVYKKMALFNAFNLSIPGIPIIYYGDEIGMAIDIPSSRGMMRFQNLNQHEQGLKDEISKLTKLRQENMAMLYGSTEILFVKDNVLVIRRKYFDNEVILMINKASTPAQASMKKSDKILFDLSAPAYGYSFKVK